MKRTVREQAEGHWDWLEVILLQQLAVSKKLYIDAFIHGYKHGVEDEKAEWLSNAKK